MHSLKIYNETDNDAIFKCEVCGTVIGFNKEGVGYPYATQVDGVWTPLIIMKIG